jgi:hypothetical protein
MGLVERLHEEIAHGPVAAALAARAAVAVDAEAAARIADNADLDVSVRVAALLAVALVAQDGVRVPDVALAALEDDLLIDAVLASGTASAITGVLCAAGDRASDGLRRYLALRITAAGATGIHVAALLVDVGDVAGAVRAAAPAMAAPLRDGADDDPAVLALAAIVTEWSRSHAAIADVLAEALPPDARAALLRAMRNVAAD